MTSRLAERYFDQGYVHVSGVFGADRTAAAIRAVEALPAWIRATTGDPDIQRVQPLQSCAALADAGWLAAFYDNRELDRIVGEIFAASIAPAPKMSRDHRVTGLLIDPRDRWWSTGLHRDYRDFLPGLDVEAWRAKGEDPRFFNQVNIPLLPDASFWVVPGSHRRDDRGDEAEMVRERLRYRPDRAETPERARARQDALIAGLTACGAVNIAARPGDLVIYRSNMLHCGMYRPGAPRLTLHDAVYSPEWHRYALEVIRPPGRRRGPDPARKPASRGAPRGPRGAASARSADDGSPA